MKVIDNKIEKLGDDLKSTIKDSYKLQICASIFSMFGFQSLKKELMRIDSLKFIFTDLTFVQEVNSKKETRMFKLDLHSREKSINGNEFEVRLKKELNWKAIAKECAKKHFALLFTHDVKYGAVASYQDLIDLLE